MTAFLYILECADKSYYVGTTRSTLEKRVLEHNAGKHRGYTHSRRPVRLRYHQEFQRVEDAVSAERQIKGWRRAKKEALIKGEFSVLTELARRKSKTSASS